GCISTGGANCQAQSRHRPPQERQGTSRRPQAEEEAEGEIAEPGRVMKYDDASWHFGGDFPSELPTKNGATHIAMFFAWRVNEGLVGEMHIEESVEELQLLQTRQVSPVDFFLRCCDGKLIDEDLSDVGNAFASHYFSSEESGYGQYLSDYETTLATDLLTIYH